MKRFFDSLIDNKEDYIEGEIVDLRFNHEVDENTAYDGIPTVYYDIVLHGDHKKVGNIDLRLKMDDNMYYYGHVGYDIYSKYRGHNYSYEACKVLFKIAKDKYKFDELYLTCNPDNIASYKTLKKLKGELVEVVEVPHDHELYKLGDRMKCIFRYRISI